MKKILSMAVLLLSISPAFAQLYIRANVGYSLPINSQMIGEEIDVEYVPDEGDVGTVKGVYGSYGNGFSFQVALGGSFNGSLGYDVEAGYIFGSKNTIKSNYDYSYFGYEEVEESTSYARSFQFAPAITFTAGTGAIQPYTRMGPVIAITSLHSEENEYDTYSETEEEYEYKLSGGMSIGFKGVVGIIFNSDKKIQFFTEINFTSMSYSPKEGEITKYTVNGEDMLDQIPEEERKIKFEKEVDFEGEGGSDTQLQEKFSMGSIGLQAGIRFMLK